MLLARVFTSPALGDSDEENERRLVQWLEGVLEDGRARGELREDADLESFIHLFIANISSGFRSYALGDGGDPTELMSRRLRLLLKAVEATR